MDNPIKKEMIWGEPRYFWKHPPSLSTKSPPKKTFKFATGCFHPGLTAQAAKVNNSRNDDVTILTWHLGY